jgi:RNA polymerase sigma factor (sigma-70 family)
LSELTQADQYLLEQIRQGSADGWAQLVGRYQGRLLAYARSRLSGEDAEDTVQETFLALLKDLGSFRQEASLETYLFAILRRKVVDSLRGRRFRACLLQGAREGEDDSSGAMQRLPAREATASWYARRSEDAAHRRAVLEKALRRAVRRFQEEGNLRDLQIVELLFYGQASNREAAQLAGVKDNHVAVLKHRFLKEVAGLVRSAGAPPEGPEGTAPEEENLLADIWESLRLSCLKRSTIGAWLLGTLEPAWAQYVEFHLNRLGCRSCRANLEDLQRPPEGEPAVAARKRILASTVGFLRRPGASRG